MKIKEIDEKLNEANDLLEGDPQKAIKVLQQIDLRDATQEQEHDYLFALGEALYFCDQLKEAIEIFKRILNGNFSEKEIRGCFHYLGMCYADLGKDSESVFWFEKQLNVDFRLDRWSAHALLSLTTRYLNLNDLSKSIDTAEKVIGLLQSAKENDLIEVRNMAMIALINRYWLTKQVDKALATFKELMSTSDLSDSVLADAYGQMGHAYVQEGKLEEAISHYEQALEICKKDPELKDAFQHYKKSLEETKACLGRSR